MSNPVEYGLVIAFVCFALFFACVSVKEVFEPNDSSKYHDLRTHEIIVVKAASCLAGLGLAFVCGWLATNQYRETRKNRS